VYKHVHVREHIEYEAERTRVRLENFDADIMRRTSRLTW